MIIRILCVALLVWGCDDDESQGPRQVDGSQVDASTDGAMPDSQLPDAMADLGQGGAGGQPDMAQADAGEPVDMGQGGMGGMPPGCMPDTVAVQATLEEERMYHRADPARIDVVVQADGATELTFESDQGGIFTERDTFAFWAAGGGEPGHVDWPWWTGPVTITVRATDAQGCSGETTVSIQLAGDVLVAEGQRSYLFAFGSDGRRLGRFRQIDEQGLSGATLLPPDVGGGIVLCLRKDSAAEVAGYLRWMSDDGQDFVDFDRVDLAGSPLWETSRHPWNVVYDAVNGYVVADRGVDGSIHRFLPTGEYVDSIVVPGANNFRNQVRGFAVLGDGSLLMAFDRTRQIHRLAPDGTFSEFTVGGRDVSTVTTARDGGAMIIEGNANQVTWRYFDQNGREIYTQMDHPMDAEYLIPFMDGYLSAAASGPVRYADEGLQVPPGDESPFQYAYDFEDVSTPEAIIWLNR